MEILKSRLGYLSAAPRISTDPEAEASGPRSHILGFIRTCETLGWEVKPFIVGDRVPREWVTRGSDLVVSKGFLRALATDALRVGLGANNARKAWQELGGQVDWIYERYAAFSALGRPFKRHGIPWILETNAPMFYEAKTERKSMVLTELARQMEIRAYRECDVLVCITEALKELVVDTSGISSDKVIIVPNGVDTTVFDPNRHPPKRQFDGMTIGFVGNLYPRQGVDLLIEALRDLRQEGLNWSLVVVGYGPMRDEWEAKACEFDLGDRVKFVGQVPWHEVPQYIAGFDLCYTGQTQLPVGKMYHSPLKLYEYMAMAKPVVASAFEDARRTIEEGNTGFLFEPGNVQSLKQALIRANCLKERLPEIGKQAREATVTQHSWKARVSAMTARIEQILSSS
jgi:glycosyltransferase involved in cell wall biosynthesis